MEQKIKTLAIPADARLLSKAECTKLAREIIESRKITGMSEKEIACELYFHVFVLYICKALRRYHLPVQKLIDHADPIDLADNGDTRFRKICFLISWHLPELKIRHHV